MTNLQLRAVSHPLLKRIFKTPWIGRYRSFEEARKATPSLAVAGYNQKDIGEMFKTWPVDRMRPADYAVLMHLQRLLKPGGRLVDLGGAIGMACYTAQKFSPLPAGFEWLLCELPAMLEAAKDVAEREGAKSAPLRYISSLNDAGAVDIFFSSGALHYIETPLATMLSEMDALPPSVLINRIPVWDRERLVTLAVLHNNDYCLTPYQVFNRQQFVASMEAIGYALVDHWTAPESTFSVRFHPRTRLKAYQGFYFSLL